MSSGPEIHGFSPVSSQYGIFGPVPRTDSARKRPKIAPKTDIGTFAVFRALFEDFSAFAIGCAVMAAETGLRALSRPTRLHEID